MLRIIINALLFFMVTKMIEIYRKKTPLQEYEDKFVDCKITEGFVVPFESKIPYSSLYLFSKKQSEILGCRFVIKKNKDEKQYIVFKFGKNIRGDYPINTMAVGDSFDVPSIHELSASCLSSHLKKAAPQNKYRVKRDFERNCFVVSRLG